MNLAVAVGVIYMWQVTPDTWHLTPDSWHVTPDACTWLYFLVMLILGKYLQKITTDIANYYVKKKSL